jgi:hypothetical protein
MASRTKNVTVKVEMWREDTNGKAVYAGKLAFKGEGGTSKELLRTLIKPAVKAMLDMTEKYTTTALSHTGIVQWREDLMKVTLEFDGVSQELLGILHDSFQHALGKLSTDLKAVQSFTTNRPDLWKMTGNSRQGIFVDRPLGSRGDKDVRATCCWNLPLGSLDPIQKMDLWSEPKPKVYKMDANNTLPPSLKRPREDDGGEAEVDRQNKKGDEHSYIVTMRQVGEDCSLEITATYAGTCPTKGEAEDRVADLVVAEYERTKAEDELYLSMNHVKKEGNKRLYCYLKRLEDENGVASCNIMLDHISFCDQFQWEVQEGTSAVMHYV